VKKEKGKEEEEFDTRKQAIQSAKKKAESANASVTIQSKHGKIESRQSFNPNRKASKKSYTK